MYAWYGEFFNDFKYHILEKIHLKRPILLYFVNFSISISIGALKLKKLDHLSNIYSSYDTFIIDLWGVMHNGIELYKEAVEVLTKISEAKKNYILLTNAPRPNKNVEN